MKTSESKSKGEENIIVWQNVMCVVDGRCEREADRQIREKGIMIRAQLRQK